MRAEIDLLQIGVEPSVGEDALLDLVSADQRQRIAILELEQMAIEPGRAAHRLAGVVDDEVEPRELGVQVLAELLHAGRVPQIESEYFQPIAPVHNVRLPRVARRRITRKPRRHDDVRARAKELESCLISDLDAAACDERDASAEVGELVTFRVVRVAARATEPVVEMVDGRVLLLADVAAPRLVNLAPLVAFRVRLISARRKIPRLE